MHFLSFLVYFWCYFQEILLVVQSMSNAEGAITQTLMHLINKDFLTILNNRYVQYRRTSATQRHVYRDIISSL